MIESNMDEIYSKENDTNQIASKETDKKVNNNINIENISNEIKIREIISREKNTKQRKNKKNCLQKRNIAKNKTNTYFIYTAAFLLMIPFVFLPFLLEGKSFVWYLDGLDQHLPLLTFYGKLLRGIVSQKGFPMIDFQLGLGFDTMTTMNYYVMGDPLALLTVFMTSKNSVIFYNFLVLLRFYLSGISFLIFAKYWKKDGIPAVIGALMYVFCGYALIAGIKHPFFMNPMIYLPLLLLGTEKVLRRSKPYLMITMVFISAVSNFYFLYDLTIITVVYIIFRYFTVYRKSYWNMTVGFLLTGLRTGGYYLFGIILSAFMLLPVVYAFLQNGRLNAGPELLTGLLAYKNRYYISFLQSFIAAGVTPGFWTLSSFSAVTVLSFTTALCEKQFRKLRIIYLMVLAGLSIPAFGFFMNGFSYTANRWCFLFSFLTAVTFTITYPSIFAMRKITKIVLAAEIFLYGLLAYCILPKQPVKNAFYLLLLVLFVFLIVQLKWFQEKRVRKDLAVLILVLVTIGFNGYATYSPDFVNYASQFLSEKEVCKAVNMGNASGIAKIRDHSLYRIDAYGDKALNKTLTLGYNGVSGYYSLMDGAVTEYLKGMEILNQKSSYRFDNLDNRTVPNELAGVKYFVTQNKKAVPYGYRLVRKIKTKDKRVYLYQNKYALPIGYIYKNYILKTEYNKLNAIEKQNIMMKAVVLEQDTGYADKINSITDTGVQKLHKVTITSENADFAANCIRAWRTGAKLTVSYHAKPNTEVFIRLGKLTIGRKHKIITGFSGEGNHSAPRRITIKSAYFNSYFGKEDYLVNAGYSKDGGGRMVFTFPKKESYRCGSLEAYSMDMNYYKEQAKALQENSLRNIRQKNNQVEGDITLLRPGLMTIAIPYSKGWSAYVDGNRQNILRGNVMYMVLPLCSGNHHIILRYETPYLKEGFFLSLTAFLTGLGVFLYHYRLKLFKFRKK